MVHIPKEIGIIQGPQLIFLTAQLFLQPSVIFS